MKKPNFFIVGAPKCGTTALSEYLKTHPNIFMSSPKEPHYFAPIVKDLFYPASTEKEYLSLFVEANETHKIIGEASVMYMYFKNSINLIYNFNPKAKLVVMLRNPVDLAYSWHSQAVYNTDENITDFEKAWDLQEKRKNGLKIPKSSRMPFALQYKNIASIGTQVDNLLKIFPREQVHFIFMEDFKNNVRKEYLKVLSFLDLDDDKKKEFPIMNQNKVYKSYKIAKLKRTRLANFIRYIKNILGFDNVPIMKKIYEWNRTEKSRKTLHPNFRRDVVNAFIPEIELLEKNLDKDLSHWKK